MTDYFSIALPEDNIRAISSIGLAHIGDGVYELLVRTYLCAHGKATGKGLHRATVDLVRAPEQARRAQRILPLLTEAEQEVFAGAETPMSTPFPSMPAGQNTSRPLPWRHCLAGCICGGSGHGSTSYLCT